jgi:hypothetical protein
MEERRKASLTGSDERHNALEILTKMGAVGPENVDKFLSPIELYDHRDHIFPDEDVREMTDKRFLGWWDTSRIDFIKNKSAYGGAELLIYTRFDHGWVQVSVDGNDKLVYTDPDGKSVQVPAGKQRVYGLARPYVRPISADRVHESVDELAKRTAALVACNQNLPAGLQAREAFQACLRDLGLAETHMLTALTNTGFTGGPGSFLITKQDGVPLTRQDSTFHAELSSTWQVLSDAVASGVKISFLYRKSPLQRLERKVLDPVCAVLSIKNSAIHVYGCLNNKKESGDPAKLSTYRDPAGVEHLGLYNFKLDRMSDAKLTGEASQVTDCQRAELRKYVDDSDGTFIVPKGLEFSCVLRVSRHYTYFFESNSFKRIEPLTAMEATALGATSGDPCFRVIGTTNEHLINEMIKARGNISILEAPAHCLEMLVEELRNLQNVVLHGKPCRPGQKSKSGGLIRILGGAWNRVT